MRNGVAGDGIRREWIEFNLTAPGTQPRRVERVLFQADEQAKQPSVERRYTISILPGRVSWALADEQTRIAKRMVNVRDLVSTARRVASVSPTDPGARNAAVELGKIIEAIGPVTGHLLALRFAAESDSVTTEQRCGGWP